MAVILVVTYNSADVIDACLEGCQRMPGAQVVVVDNASTDGTADRVRRWPTIRLIANATNRGFAAAVNQGMAAVTDEAVLLLNPDAVPLTGIEPLERAVCERGVGAATGRLLDGDGSDQHGFNVRGFPSSVTLIFEVLGVNRLWSGNSVNRRYRLRSPKERAFVPQPAGAFLMLRRSVWRELGGFDEGFFPIWFEDVDYCKRLHNNGYRIIYVPEVSAGHLGGHSAGKLIWGERQVLWYGSLLRYASKHFSGASRAALAIAVILGCLPRAIVAIGRVGVAEAMSVYVRVVCLTGQSLRQGERGRGTPAFKEPVKEQFKQSR